MKLYHGSPNKFKEFSLDNLRVNGTDEGVGIYFSDNKKIATGYGEKGYLYTVKLNGNKALSDETITVNRTDLRNYLTELNKQTDILSNYGEIAYSGLNKILNVALDNILGSCESDNDILGSIYNTVGEDPIAINLFYRILGYDHIKPNAKWGNDGHIHVALTNDIIKILNIEEL